MPLRRASATPCGPAPHREDAALAPEPLAMGRHSQIERKSPPRERSAARRPPPQPEPEEPVATLSVASPWRGPPRWLRHRPVAVVDRPPADCCCPARHRAPPFESVPRYANGRETP